MGWKPKFPTPEYDSADWLNWGSQIAKLLDHAKIPYVACGDLMNVHYQQVDRDIVRQTNHIID